MIFETFDHSGEQIKKNTKTKKGTGQHSCDVFRLA